MIFLSFLSFFVPFFMILPHLSFQDLSKVRVERKNGSNSGVIDYSNFKKDTPITQKPGIFEPTPIPTSEFKLPCPGESNPDFPVCMNVRGSLQHKDFRENSVCVYTEPDTFAYKTAVIKSVLFAVVAAFGIIG